MEANLFPEGARAVEVAADYDEMDWPITVVLRECGEQKWNKDRGTVMAHLGGVLAQRLYDQLGAALQDMHRHSVASAIAQQAPGLLVPRERSLR